MDNYTIGAFVTELLDQIRREPKSARGTLLTTLRREIQRQTQQARGELAYQLRDGGASPGVTAALMGVAENTALALLTDHAERNKLPMPTRRRNVDDVSNAATLPSDTSSPGRV